MCAISANKKHVRVFVAISEKGKTVSRDMFEGRRVYELSFGAICEPYVQPLLSFSAILREEGSRVHATLKQNPISKPPLKFQEFHS